MLSSSGSGPGVAENTGTGFVPVPMGSGTIGGGTLSADAGFRNGAGGLAVRTRMALTNADATAAIAAELAKHGILTLDAPVSGGVPAAVAGKITIIASGADAA